MKIQGKRILVAGLGESGLAMAKWLARERATVRVADSRAAPPGLSALRAALPDVEVRLGEFSEADFLNAELIALSPGISVDIAPIKAARAAGIPVVSEIELFARGIRAYFPSSRAIAITGSNGKTTTTALTAHLLNGVGVPARACGNISPSALFALMEAQDARQAVSVWVLELSSFQLETTETLFADAATILNVTEDHLDRYSGIDAYAAAKERVFQGCGVRVLNRDDERYPVFTRAGQTETSFGLGEPTNERDYGLSSGFIVRGAQRLLDTNELKINGLHNAANAMAALALCEAVGVAPQTLVPALKAFSGLPHRVERVAEIGGVTYYDDSKGTNVGATLAAICGLPRKMAVILGGEGKGQDFSPLKDALSSRARAVALIGRDAAIIKAAIEGCGVPQGDCASLEDAVLWCAARTVPGDAVLLSPACASFDMFRGYVHRAEVFVGAVRRLETRSG